MVVVLLVIALALLCIVPPVVGLIGAVVGWGTFFGSFTILEPYVPSRGARILIMTLWLGVYLYFMAKALLVTNGPDFGYMIAAIATFWIPAIIIWILASKSKNN